MPYGFGGGAIPRRLAGAFGAPDDFDFGLGVGGAGADAEAEGTSSGSPIDIVEGIVVEGSGGTTGRGGGSGAVSTRVGVCGFGSSVETAMTAAAVRETTIPPRRSKPIRAASFLGWASGAGMLRIGRRPRATSWAVYTWNVTGPDGGGASSSGMMEGDDH